MYYRQIQCFAAVAKTGSFTAAARLLHVSQPALCGQIKLLEERLGAKLFTRHSRGVFPTEAGALYLPQAENVLAAVQRAEAAIAGFRKNTKPEISLGMTPTPGQLLVPRLLQYYHERGSGTGIFLRHGLSDELWRLIVDGEIDAAVCYDPVKDPRITIVPLYREDLYLIGPPALVSTDSDIPFHELSRYPLVLDHRSHVAGKIINRVARAQGVELNVVLELELVPMKRDMLLHHRRCSILPYGLFLEEITAGKLKARRISSPSISRTAAFIARTTLPKQSKDFILSAVRPVIRKLIAGGKLGWRKPSAK